MKRILLISILLLVKISMVIAQPKSGEYKQNPEIDKFVGTWEWVSGNEKFQIVIGKQKLDAIKNSSMIGGSYADKAIDFVSKDYGKKKSGIAKLELLSGKTNEARWTLESVYAGDIRIVDPNDSPEPEGFSVPTNVVMKKVK